MSLTAEKKEKKPKRKRPTTYGKKYRKKKKPTEVKMAYANKLEDLRSISDSDDEEYFTADSWDLGRRFMMHKNNLNISGPSFHERINMEHGIDKMKQPKDKDADLKNPTPYHDLSEESKDVSKHNYKVRKHNKNPNSLKKEKRNVAATKKLYKSKKREESSESTGVGSSGRKPIKVKLYKNKKKVTTYQPGKKLPKDLFSALK